MQTVTIIGAGRAGGALAIALARADWPVEKIVYHLHFPEKLKGTFSSESFTRSEAFTEVDTDLLIIATADPEIRPVADRIAGFERLPETALHLSGSLDSRELAPLAEKGVAVGSFHPLVSISDPIAAAERFAGSYVCLEGTEKAVQVSRQITASLGAESFSIATEFKPLYHASAVMASGHVTALIDTAIETLARCGLTSAEAKQILLPLITGTIVNLERQSTADALTGTFARGDSAAFERHLAAIDRLDAPDAREIYLILAERSIELLRREKGDSDALDRLDRAISIAKENSR